jgi:23S rRNA (adenine2030-N6)-methyltransferase
MNYRHAFHAGNFADVHKHSILARILVHLRLKPAAFRVIDTHAGAGRYDLFAAEPTRSGEWHRGIELIWTAGRHSPAQAWLAPYLDAVAALNPDGRLRIYPGSPLIITSLLRRQDRLIACELEPHTAAALASVLRGDRRAKAVAIDGWTALGAYTPPKERRGLVLIDPPFEEGDEFARLAEALAVAKRKWPTGIYLLWYPIKDRGGPEVLARAVRKLGVPNLLRCELMVGLPDAEAGLAGSGLLIANPPFTLEADLRDFMPVLASLLSPAATARADRLTPVTAPKG